MILKTLLPRQNILTLTAPEKKFLRLYCSCEKGIFTNDSSIMIVSRGEKLLFDEKTFNLVTKDFGSFRFDLSKSIPIPLTLGESNKAERGPE